MALMMAHMAVAPVNKRHIAFIIDPWGYKIISAALSPIRKPKITSEVPRWLRNVNVVLVKCFFFVNPSTSMIFVTPIIKPSINWLLAKVGLIVKESYDLGFVSLSVTFIITF